MKKGKKIIIANWKMNPITLEEAKATSAYILKAASKLKKVQAIICPPHIFVTPLKEKKIKGAFFGVQNFFYEEKGSFTGEVSVDMVAKLKITHAIIGHSERRKLGETDEIINKKIHLALKNNITPIICVGEDSRDEEGTYLGFIKQQLEKAFLGVTLSQLTKVVIAYEPIWAIGASAAMEPHEIHQMKLFITKMLFDIYKTKSLGTVPILYGGSVDVLNAESILDKGEADGLLIGRVSLDKKAFSEILKIANSI